MGHGLRFLAALLISALWLGCGRSGAPQGTSASDRAAAAGRTHELIIALQSDGVSLDPHTVSDAGSMRLIENLYSTLLRYGEVYGEVEPDLATSWTISEDGLVYTFRLRTNAVFQISGEVVTAEDVVYSLDRIRELGVRASHFEPVAKVTAPDSFTVVITLTEPFAALLSYLAHPMNAVVDRRVAADQGLQSKGGGSGPFRLERWRKDDRFRMVRHEAYHLDGRPRLDAVTFRPISDDTARITAMRNGEIDVILDLAARDIDRLDGMPGVTVTSVPGTFWEYLGLNTTRPPFDDVRVRQAVAWAVDREVINQLVKFGQALPLKGGPIPPNHWAHLDEVVYPAQDLDRARALLAEAGVAPEALKVDLLVGSDFAYQVQAAEVVKQQLRAAGLEVTVVSLESGMFFNRLGERDFDMALVGWLGFVDPDEWTYNLFRTGAPWNQQGFSHPDVDSALAEGRRLLDREQRKPVYDRVQRILTEQAPMVFLFINERAMAALDDVRGFEAHPTVTTLSLRDTWLER
ncbi:MAG TPA: ABC transporter substrate-binding protein [Kiritimatiellia bacterium]|nr:ABC transporter substrate-binding protein [Kiritimatiellia bacterium]